MWNNSWERNHPFDRGGGRATPLQHNQRSAQTQWVILSLRQQFTSIFQDEPEINITDGLEKQVEIEREKRRHWRAFSFVQE